MSDEGFDEESLRPGSVQTGSSERLRLDSLLLWLNFHSCFAKLPGEIGKSEQEVLLQAIGNARGGSIGIYTIGYILILPEYVHSWKFQLALLLHKTVRCKSIPKNGCLIQTGVANLIDGTAEGKICWCVYCQWKPGCIAPVPEGS